jgi:glycosyltransferase involved in cell wall biosynthesis
MKISVIIPTFNSAQTIKECLHSFTTQTYPPHEVIVIDGKSIDSTVELVKACNSAQLLINERSHTPGSSRNRGAEAAEGEILFFCDSDCIADMRTLEYHAHAYKQNNDIDGVIGSICRAGSKNVISDFVQKQILASEWGRKLNQDGTVESHFSCANFTMKREQFLSEKFQENLKSYEDIELSIRLKQNGLKIFFEPRAVVYHYHPTTIEKLFQRYMWYGEGLFEVEKIHGTELWDSYLFFSPARYFTFPEQYLQEAVFHNNALLCNDCFFASLQQCKISEAQLMKKELKSDVDFHRVVCLAIATGILKKRTTLD